MDASYYGYNLDEEDGTLLAYELEKEKEAYENLLKSGDGDSDPAWEPLPGDAGDGKGWTLPSAEEVHGGCWISWVDGLFSFSKIPSFQYTQSSKFLTSNYVLFGLHLWRTK